MSTTSLTTLEGKYICNVPNMHPIEYMAKVFSVNTLRSKQNDRHFTDDLLKGISFNENALISIKISLKFVPKGPIYNKSALIQVMAWLRTGDKPLHEPMLTQFTDAYMHHSASVS